MEDIVGATGLVGSRLVSRLTSSGNTVRVISRNIGNAKRRLPYGKTDFFGTQQLKDAIRGTDAVVNLAGALFHSICRLVSALLLYLRHRFHVCVTQQNLTLGRAFEECS